MTLFVIVTVARYLIVSGLFPENPFDGPISLFEAARQCSPISSTSSTTKERNNTVLTGGSVPFRAELLHRRNDLL